MDETGMNLELVKETYKNVQGYVESFEEHMNKLHDLFVGMNRDAWYGGEMAKKAYTTIQGNYRNNVEYIISVKDLQEQIISYYNEMSKLVF